MAHRMQRVSEPLLAVIKSEVSCFPIGQARVDDSRSSGQCAGGRILPVIANFPALCSDSDRGARISPQFHASEGSNRSHSCICRPLTHPGAVCLCSVPYTMLEYGWQGRTASGRAPGAALRGSWSGGTAGACRRRPSAARRACARRASWSAWAPWCTGRAAARPWTGASWQV